MDCDPSAASGVRVYLYLPSTGLSGGGGGRWLTSLSAQIIRVCISVHRGVGATLTIVTTALFRPTCPRVVVFTTVRLCHQHCAQPCSTNKSNSPVRVYANLRGLFRGSEKDWQDLFSQPQALSARYITFHACPLRFRARPRSLDYLTLQLSLRPRHNTNAREHNT